MDEVLHVTNLYHPYVGGTEEYVRNVAGGISGGKYNSTVLTSDGLFQGLGHPLHDIRRDTERYSPKRETKDGVRLIRVPYCYSTNLIGERAEQVLTYLLRRGLSPLSPLLSGLFSDPVGVKLFLQGRSQNPDLIHASSVDDSSIVAAIMIAQHHEVPCIVRPFWHFEEYDPDTWVPILNQAASIVASSEFEKQFLQSEGVPEKKLTIIGGGVKYDAISRADGGSSPVQSRKFSVLIMSSRYTEGKGIPQSIEAAKRFSDVQFYFAGPMDNLDAQQLPENCEYLGGLYGEEKHEAFAACDLFLLPSVEESFGMVYIEAMSAGTPVVTADIPVCKELYGNVGLQVNPDDLECIANAVRRFRDNQELYEACSRAALETAREYRWTKVVDETEALFTRVLNEARN